MTILVCGAQPVEILDALGAALLTDDEMSHSHRWSSYVDPFGDWHEDPCSSLPDRVTDAPTGGHYEGDDR